MLGGITSLFPLKIKLFTMCRSFLVHQYSAIPFGQHLWSFGHPSSIALWSS